MIPLTIIIKIIYLLTGDSNPIFYTQERIGLNGKPFNMYKYRSMVYDSDKQLELILQDPKFKKEWEENQKIEDDPRITKFGKFLRKTSIDEVPQFINVFKGDMSVIGPRPLIPGELEKHNGDKKYNSIKPGITGWWAVNGRSNNTYENRLKLEYYYIDNRNILLDIKIIFMTIFRVLTINGVK